MPFQPFDFFSQSFVLCLLQEGQDLQGCHTSLAEYRVIEEDVLEILFYGGKQELAAQGNSSNTATMGGAGVNRYVEWSAGERFVVDGVLHQDKAPVMTATTPDGKSHEHGVGHQFYVDAD